MSWTDKELDELFQDSAGQQTFDYNSAYFKDIEAQLPINRGGKDFLYLFFGLMSIVLFFLTPLVSIRTTEANVNNPSLANATPVQKNAIVNSETKNSNSFLTNKQLLSQSKNNSNLFVNEFPSRNNLIQKRVDLDLNNSNEGLQQVSNVEDQVEFTSVAPEEIGELNIRKLGAATSSNSELIAQHFAAPKARLAKSRMYVEFNGGIGQSPINSSELGSGRSMTWGVNSGYIFTKNNWSLSAGLGFSQQHYENLFIKERSTIYGFGVNTLDNHYEFNSMFKLEIPLQVSYRFGNHELTAGFSTSIPVFASVRYSELKDGVSMEEGKAFSSTSPYFKKILLEPSLTYRFALDQHWSIGAVLKAQAFNPLNSDRIKGERNKLPLSGQIVLRRTLDLSK